ncbi:MAG: beta-lactamase family protein [Actinomycetota bacterium]|nr:beta-lactamase family protein [Actinomycetota bacterium]
MTVEDRLQGLVDADISAWPQMPGRLLHVLAPSRGVDVEVAAGVADLRTGAPLQPGSRFRIASVTKPFVAAATLRLVEDERLSLDATVAELLAGEYDDLLRSGGYETDAITLRHLLTHTSGIYDFAADAYTDQITDGFSAQVAIDPLRRWTRYEQIEFAVSHGEPYGPPGTVFGYSDTGACLVGEILERVTGVSMGAAIWELVGYDRLGLTTTWQESVELEPPDLPPLSHQYEHEMDVADMDASVDLYGGGGLMSTCRDLARFFRALLRDAVFQRPETLATMTTTLQNVPRAPLTSDGRVTDAAMFLFRADVGGETWWGHDGYWGTSAYTCPARDVTVVAGHQRSDMPDAFDRMAIVADALGVLDGA